MPAYRLPRRTFAAVLLTGAAIVSFAGPSQADRFALGGVQGVASAADEGGLAARSAITTRSAQVVPALQPVLIPIVAATQPAGELRLWMENFPDMRVPIGTAGRLNVSSSRPGHMMLWSMGATGAVFSIADGITPGRPIVEVGPDRTAILPSQQGFEIVLCPPAGHAVWFALHSDIPIPAAARDQLARELNGARIAEPEGAARFRAVVERVIADTPNWAARSHTMIYEVLPGPTDSRCAPVPEATPVAAPVAAPPVLPPAPAPAPVQPVQVAPSAAAQPALAWIQPSAQPIEVRLSASSFRAQETMRVDVRAPVACPSLTVLALGAGGAVDVLLPNARPLASTPAAHETVTVPRIGSGIQLHVRPPPAPGAVERVVALCDTRDAQPIYQRRASDGPTTTLQPSDPDFADLVRRVEEAHRNGRLLVGLVTYTNHGVQ